MNVRHLVLGTVSVPLLALSPTREELRFSPASDTEVTKTFVIHGNWSSDEVTLDVSDGRDADIMIEAEWTRSVEVTDTYVSASEGRPTELRRTFEEIGDELQYELEVEADGFEFSEAPSGERTSELTGEIVSFTWDDEDESYRVAFVDEDADEDLLENLVEDMDLRALLPEDEVAEGDRWEPDAAAVAALFLPGGDLSFETDVASDGTPPEILIAGLAPALLTDLDLLIGTLDDGEVKAVYSGTREEDGERLAVIELEVEFETSRDVSEVMQAMLEPLSEELPGIELERADLEFTFEGEGRLLWNLSAGHVHSFELEGDATATLERTVSLDMGGEVVEIMTLIDLSGELQLRVSAE